MTDSSTTTLPLPRRAYYGWTIVGVAALAMVGTLPGRTQGLGLITEPLAPGATTDPIACAVRSVT